MTANLLIGLVAVTVLIIIVAGLMIGDYRREDDEI